jgi:hypothetical protein
MSAGCCIHIMRFVANMAECCGEPTVPGSVLCVVHLGTHPNSVTDTVWGKKLPIDSGLSEADTQRMWDDWQRRHTGGAA